MGGDPTKQLIAIVLATIALIFYIAAAGVPDWEHADLGGGATFQVGAFRFCVKAPSQTKCASIYPDCTIHGDSTGTIQPSDVCNQVRAVEGVLILALLFTAVVVILMCVVRFGHKEVSPLAIHVLLGVASVCAIISFGVFINKLDPPPFSGILGATWTLGAGVALTIVAWILDMACIAVWHLAGSGTA